MKTKPACFSISEDMDAMIRQRISDEKMTFSEYIRKAIREEMEKNRVRKMMILNPQLI